MPKRADVVLTNGHVTTMSDSRPEAEAIAIVGNRIVAVGSNSEIVAWEDNDTHRIDAEGRRVIPGLIDPHVHFARAGLTFNQEVRWGTVESLHQGLDLIAQRASEVPTDQWITVIGGWHPAQFEEGRHPTIEDLDRVAPDHPVYVQYLYEYGILNRRGRELVPLERAVGEGVDPSTVDVDSAGIPTGTVRTLPSLKWLYSQLPQPSQEDQVASTTAAGREFAQFGITGLIDGGGANTGPDVYRPIYETWRRGRLVPRVRLTLHSSGPGEEETEVGGFLRFLHPRQGDERLSILGVGEIVMWPYHDDFTRVPHDSEENRERLEKIFRAAADAGWTVQMHLIHPQTTELVVDLWTKVHRATPIDTLRWSIVHGESVTDQHIDRLASLGAGVIGEALLRMGGDHVAEEWNPEDLEFAPNIRRLQDNGVRVAVGSDAFRVASYNPFATLQWLTTGKSLTGRQIWHPDNVLDRREALALLTREAAWFSFEEDDRGKIEPGYLADIAVLTEDYFEVSEEAMPSIRSATTLVDGEIVWDGSR